MKKDRKIKEYTVGVWQEVSGHLYIKAETEEEAREKALGLITEYTIDDLVEENNAFQRMDVTHRDDAVLYTELNKTATK